MLALKITDIKGFMSKLLIKDTFHSFYLSEATISTFSTLNIDGKINKSFFTDEELEGLCGRQYSYWKEIQPYCFNFVKGTKTPTSMKIIYALPPAEISNLLEASRLNYTLADIEGLFINFKYFDSAITCVTGTSVRIFSMDKSLDEAFDQYIKQYLLSHEIDFES